MRGLKNKILIAFLIVISIVLGYQAFVMAEATDGCGTVFPRTSNSVPFWSGDNLILCREHTNGWKDVWSFKCMGEYKINANGKEDEAAHGMAYFLSRASTSGKNYNNEIQSWIWNYTDSLNGGYTSNGEFILSPGYDKYPTIFEGAITGTEIENFLNYVDTNTNINQSGSLKDALENKTVAIVDEVPYEFFTTSSGVTDDEVENDLRINDISFEEYNYLYQLHYVLNYIWAQDKNGADTEVGKLKDHINTYQSVDGMTIYKGNIPTETDLNKAPAVLSANNVTKDLYGQDILLTVLDLDADGNSDPHAYMWQYIVTDASADTETVNVNGQIYNVDKTIYYADDTYGTTKFSERILLNNSGMLQNYIDLYNGSYTIENLVEELKEYSETIEGQEQYKVEFDNVAAILKENCNGKKGEELYNAVSNTLGLYRYPKTNDKGEVINKNIQTIAENVNKQETTGATITNPTDNAYVFEGTTAQAAKAYQWLVDNDIFEDAANSFALNSSKSKIAVDQDKDEYIIGPFSANYCTITINNENLLELEKFEIILKNKDKEIVLNSSEYSLIKESEGQIPLSGEEFYVQISKENIENKLGHILTQDDYVGARIKYKYLEYIKATIHFLQGGKNGDGDAEGVFNRRHAQRLMTFDTEDVWNTITVDDFINPDYYNFEIIKVDKDNHETTLKGAVFGAYARYTSASGSNIYLNLENQNSGFEAVQGDYNGENGRFSVLENVEGKYETDDAGKITFKNVPGTIVYNGTEYTLKSVVAKETEAPNGCVLDQTHIEIEKNANETATYTHENIVEKPYELTIKKVNEKGEPIPGVTFRYWDINLKDDAWGAQDSVADKRTATTNDDGIATFIGKEQGDLIALVVQEVKDEGTSELNYFQSMIILYSTKTDSQGNVEIEFFSSSEPLENQWDIFRRNWLLPERDDVENGVYRIILKDGETELNGADAREYIKCGEEAGQDIDIQIENETLKKYNLELFKFDENGNTSEDLNETKFNVTIAKENTSSYQTTVEITDGKAVISDLDIYGEDISLYLIEEPVDGFKTVLANPDEDPEYPPVIKYSAYDDGNINITYINENLLNPEHIEKDDYKAADVVESENGETISLQLGIINQTEEYSLKFRKVDPEGNPLEDATFVLAEKDENEKYIELASDTSKAPDGYMTFDGLTKTGDVTLYLYEITAPNGYYSTVTSENPMIITYTYTAGSEVLKGLTIKQGESTILESTDIKISKDEAGNLGTLKSIWDLENESNPYDLELFTKVDEEGNPIANKKFQVSIYSLDESQNKIYAKYDNNGTETEIKEVELTSDPEGKVILEKVLDYGKFKVEVKEIENTENTESETDNEHELLEDTLIFTYEIKKGETEPTWGNTLTVVNGDTTTKYTKDENSTKFKSEDGKSLYEYLEIDRDDLHLINKKKPYKLVINKVNGLNGKPLEGVEFSAVVFKNLSSEKQTFNGITNANGEIVLDDIYIYNDLDDDEYSDRLSISITETVPSEDYKWYEYGKITYTIDYMKYSPNGDLELLTSGSITARIKDDDGNPAIKFLKKGNAFTISKKATEFSHDVVIENMPVYDLDLFDMKAITTDDELQEIIGKEEFDFSDALATGGITFTAEVKDANGNPLQSDVKVTFDKEKGIVAHDIDTCSEFLNGDGTFKNEVTGLQLVLTEVETNGLVKIDPITIIYDCTYNEDTGKFEPTKTGYKYQEQLKELKDFADKNAVIIDGLIYIDKDGNHVLVNTPKTTELVLRKYDEKGTFINGINFIGKIYSTENPENSVDFDITTGEGDNSDGLAVKKGIQLTGEVTVVITEEKWNLPEGTEPKDYGYSELEFIQGPITISGIVIKEDEEGNKSFDYSKAVVDPEHKDQVEINETTMEIVVTNYNLTYNLPIVKTTELLSSYPEASKLNDVVFDFIIKDDGKENDDDENLFFNDVTTVDGEINLTEIDKFGDLVLVINEKVGHEGTKMLQGKVYVYYNAESDYEENEVTITVDRIIYENEEADADKVEQITDAEDNKFLGINVVNPKDYSITLHKVTKINDKTEEATEPVTFKGIVTTNPDLMLLEDSEKKLSELSYDEFKELDFNAESTEEVVYFNEKTESIADKMLAEIEGLNFYDKQVYVYFIEELESNSTMTLIDEVMMVSFNQKDSNDGAKSVSPSDKVSVDIEDRLNIKVTVENDATAYKFNILKIDEITGEPVSSLKNAKFEFVLNELDGNATISSDKATIVFADDGEIDTAKSTIGEEYIVGCELTDDGYIQLDINKFGNLQLIITEHTAPKHYITEKDPLVIKYTAKPGEIIVDENITSEKLTVTTSNDIFGLEVKLPNTPDSYDLPVYKLVTSGIDDSNAVATNANNIDFNVRFFDTEYNEIMQNWSGVYTVAGGQFVIKDINTFGEYYMTLEETDVPDNIIPLKGIHVFKITAKSEDDVDSNGFVINEDKVKSIEYSGTGTISDNGKLTINGNKEDSKYIKTEEKLGETNIGIARLEISNETVKQYSLDLLKYSENEENPLGNVKFDLYLTEGAESYQLGDNLLKLENPYETGLNGKISIGELQLVGDYTFTIVERETKPGYTIPFDRIEISYSTEDGKTIGVNSVKVYKDGREISSNNIVNCTPANASLQIKINNPKLNDVPLNIHKVYYEDGSAIALPVKGATFTGTVTEKTSGAAPIGFTATTDENGNAHLGDFPVDGEVEVKITEIITPAGLDTIPPTTIYITVNNETKTIDTENYTVDTNALEGIEGNNTFKIVDTQTTPPPTVSLAGIVWEDIKQYSKGEETYTDGENYTEGLYDAGYDKLVEGVIVKLYQKGMNNTPIRTYVTGVNGTYVFDELDPFEKYYVTFEYDGKNYEAVNYLVSDRQGTTSYGSIEKAIDKAYWDVNSKAVTNSDNENIATTTKTKEAIATNDRGNIQYYPAYNKFTIDNEGITLYIDAETKEYTMEVEGNTVVEFKPLHPSHNWINLGIIARPPFDLSLTKDVEQIKATLNTGASMTYLYGTKPQSSMYKLELSQADIKALSELEIVYRIEVINEDVAAGLLGSVADYYNSDLLTFKEAYYKVIPDGADEPEYDISEVSSDNCLVTEDIKNIIPIQSYDSETSSLEKNTTVNTDRVTINTNVEIPTGNKAVIFVKYIYNLEMLRPSLNEINDEYVTLGVAEIYNSRTVSGSNDLDSDYGNLVGKFNSLQNFYQNNGDFTYYTTLNKDIKEDDEDTAPAAKIVVGSSGKTISGNVFEDENGNNTLDGKIEEGKFIPSEPMVNGVTVTLYNVNGDKVEKVNDVDIENDIKTEDGAYTFRNVPAGEYYITFKYGDENTVLPMLEKTNEDGTTTYVKDEIEIGGLEFSRINEKSYNTLEFENTGYTSPDSYTTGQNKLLYWYATSPERYSDAQDSEGRVEADLAISSKEEGTDLGNSTTIGIMNNALAEKMNSYKADLEKYGTAKEYVAELATYDVTAKTPKFKLNFAYTDSEELQYNEEARQGCIQYGDGTIQSEVYANNIDFGIKARPQSDISVIKEVENVKIISGGRTIVDVSYKDGEIIGQSSKVQWNKGTSNGKGYIWIQRAEEEIISATLEITYKITVANNAGEEIKVIVADYVQDGMTYSEAKNQNNGWQVVEASSVKEDDVIKSSTVGNVEINNKIDLTAVSTVVTQEMEIKDADGDKTFQNSTLITLTKQLNNYSQTDIDEYTNYVEVIQTESVGLARKDASSIFGNYDPVKQTTTEGNIGKVTTWTNGLEKDSAKALETLSITAETGENRQTYYILAFSVIAVFATGVILIKKKVLDR